MGIQNNQRAKKSKKNIFDVLILMSPIKPAHLVCIKQDLNKANKLLNHGLIIKL